MALLLLGIAAGPASATVDVSVSPSSAIGGTVQSLNFTINDNTNVNVHRHVGVNS